MREPVWDNVDTRVYLAGEAMCTQAQTAFRTAFEGPSVERVVVGTDNLMHLHELVMATTLRPDEGRAVPLSWASPQDARRSNSTRTIG
jgi:hypothetical protein